MDGSKEITYRYIKRTLDYGLKFQSVDDENDLYGYSDANWAGDIDDRRSVSRYVAGSTVSWCSKKQGTIAKSTTEAEYVSLSNTTQERIWMQRLLATR